MSSSLQVKRTSQANTSPEYYAIEFLAYSEMNAELDLSSFSSVPNVSSGTDVDFVVASVSTKSNVPTAYGEETDILVPDSYASVLIHWDSARLYAVSHGDNSKTGSHIKVINKNTFESSYAIYQGTTLKYNLGRNAYNTIYGGYRYILKIVVPHLVW